MEQVASDSDLEVTFTSFGSEGGPAPQLTDADIVGSDSSYSSEEEPPKTNKLRNRCDSSDQPSSDNDSFDEDDDDDDGSDIDHTYKQHEQVPYESEEEIEQEPSDQLQGLLDPRTGDLCLQICKDDQPSNIVCMGSCLPPISSCSNWK